MIRILPENGYDSPRSPYSASRVHIPGIETTRERRIEIFTEDSKACVEADDGEMLGKDDRKAKQHEEDVDRKAMKGGFRDRVSCYTWTWFTMNMATGGIANILHAGKHFIFSL